MPTIVDKKEGFSGQMELERADTVSDGLVQASPMMTTPVKTASKFMQGVDSDSHGLIMFVRMNFPSFVK